MVAESPLDPTDARRRVVDRLEAKRRELRLGHGAFAEQLGVDRNLWFRLRRGDRSLSWALLRRATRLWPGLLRAVVPSAPATDDEAVRAAFAAYLLTLSDDDAPLEPADLRRWWAVWRAAWRAARGEDAPDGR